MLLNMAQNHHVLPISCILYGIFILVSPILHYIVVFVLQFPWQDERPYVATNACVHFYRQNKKLFVDFGISIVMKLEDQVAVVTGGARGIGLAITKILLQNKVKVKFLTFVD
jgi:hypothetical protein